MLSGFCIWDHRIIHALKAELLLNGLGCAQTKKGDNYAVLWAWFDEFYSP